MRRNCVVLADGRVLLLRDDGYRIWAQLITTAPSVEMSGETVAFEYKHSNCDEVVLEAICDRLMDRVWSVGVKK